MFKNIDGRVLSLELIQLIWGEIYAALLFQISTSQSNLPSMVNLEWPRSLDVTESNTCISECASLLYPNYVPFDIWYTSVISPIKFHIVYVLFLMIWDTLEGIRVFHIHKGYLKLSLWTHQSQSVHQDGPEQTSKLIAVLQDILNFQEKHSKTHNQSNTVWITCLK